MSVKIYEYIAEPSKIDESALEELKKLQEKHPYFLLPRLLILLSQGKTKGDVLNLTNQKTGIYIPNPEHFFARHIQFKQTSLVKMSQIAPRDVKNAETEKEKQPVVEAKTDESEKSESIAKKSEKDQSTAVEPKIEPEKEKFQKDDNDSKDIKDSGQTPHPDDQPENSEYQELDENSVKEIVIKQVEEIRKKRKTSNPDQEQTPTTEDNKEIQSEDDTIDVILSQVEKIKEAKKRSKDLEKAGFREHKSKSLENLTAQEKTHSQESLKEFLKSKNNGDNPIEKIQEEIKNADNEESNKRLAEGEVKEKPPTQDDDILPVTSQDTAREDKKQEAPPVRKMLEVTIRRYSSETVVTDMFKQEFILNQVLVVPGADNKIVKDSNLKNSHDPKVALEFLMQIAKDKKVTVKATEIEEELKEETQKQTRKSLKERLRLLKNKPAGRRLITVTYRTLKQTIIQHFSLSNEDTNPQEKVIDAPDGSQLPTEQKQEKQTKPESAIENLEKPDEVKKQVEEKTQESEKKESVADKILRKVAERKKKQENPDSDPIEKFLKESPRIDRNKEIKAEGDISEPSVKANDDIVTPTLAQMYIDQKLYDKALDAYQKLSLKYPEKNSYFAAQIEKVNELINKQNQ